MRWEEGPLRRGFKCSPDAAVQEEHWLQSQEPGTVLETELELAVTVGMIALKFTTFLFGEIF